MGASVCENIRESCRDTEQSIDREYLCWGGKRDEKKRKKHGNWIFQLLAILLHLTLLFFWSFAW